MEVYNIAYVVILLIILVLSLVQAFLVFIIQPQEESSKPDEKPEKVMKIFSITAGSFALLFWTLDFPPYIPVFIITTSSLVAAFFFQNKTLLRKSLAVWQVVSIAALLLVHVFYHNTDDYFSIPTWCNICYIFLFLLALAYMVLVFVERQARPIGKWFMMGCWTISIILAIIVLILNPDLSPFYYNPFKTRHIILAAYFVTMFASCLLIIDLKNPKLNLLFQILFFVLSLAYIYAQSNTFNFHEEEYHNFFRVYEMLIYAGTPIAIFPLIIRFKKKTKPAYSES